MWTRVIHLRFFIFAALDSKAEVHLLLRGIYFRNLHGERVAKFNHSPRAAAHEIAPRFVEDVEIVFNRGQRHEAAHREAGNIHEETKVANIRDERGIFHRLAGFQLRAQEGKQFHVLAVALFP